MRIRKIARQARTYRLYFQRPAVIPPAEGSAAVEYQAGLWYDGVPEEHVAAVGDAAVQITLDLSCGCLRLPDGRAVVTRTKHVPAHDGQGNRYEKQTIVVELMPHQEACAFEEES